METFELNLGRENVTCPPRPVRYVITNTGCWEVISHKKHCRGYPAVYYKKRQVQISRVSWELHNGEIHNGLCVLHKCDNRKCINPEHLFLGTKGDNARDMVQKGRSLKGERHPQTKFTDVEIEYIRTNPDNLRQADLANKFDVQRDVIHKIVRGISWKHLPNIWEVSIGRK